MSNAATPVPLSFAPRVPLAAHATLRQQLASHPGFARWHGRNVVAHRVPGYAAVTLSLKRTGTLTRSLSITIAELRQGGDLPDGERHEDLQRSGQGYALRVSTMEPAGPGPGALGSGHRPWEEPR